MKNLVDKMYTPKQWEVTKDIKENDPRLTIFEGAIRSGKTYLGILYWNAIVSKYVNKLFIMTGHTISSLKRNVLDDISKLFGIDTHLNANNEFEMYGNRIACFGTDKSDSFKAMRGLTAQGWYANEIILSHQNSVLEAFGRCSETNHKIIWETNPDKPNHYIKTNYIDKSGDRLEDDTLNVKSYHFKLEDNTFLDHNFIESVKKSIPEGTVYDRQIKGLWRATEKAVYQNYEIVDNIPSYKVTDTCYGLDFGYNNPSALVKIEWCDNEPYITGCFLTSKLITSELVEEVKKHVNNMNHPIYCDTAEPDKIRALQDAGFNAMGSDKKVIEGINVVKEYRLYLLRDTDLIRSVENYEFRSNAQGVTLEEPIKYDDHYPDAIRYAIKTHRKTGDNKIFSFGYKVGEFEY